VPEGAGPRARTLRRGHLDRRRRSPSRGSRRLIAAKAHRGTNGISPGELSRWLLAEQYVVLRDDLLVPTERVLELAWTS
jgi:hypothetical protein